MNNAKKKVSAIVLAAGESKRMKERNKLLLPFRTKTVIRYVIENIIAAGLDEVIVVLGHEAEKVKVALTNLSVKFVLNENFEKGMTTSIQSGIKNATGAGYMICLSDMVMITSGEYSLMKDKFLQQLEHDSACICLPRYNSEKGNPVIFSSHYSDAILQHREMEGCKTIVQQNKDHIYWIEMNTRHVLQDMDSPEDYELLNL